MPGMQILDAGCGGGRNLIYFLQEGYRVFGVDADPLAIAEVRRLASVLAPDLPLDHFRVEPLEAMSFPDAFADFVISSAVLHFAQSEQHFSKMLRGTWRVLKPGGVLFCRLASRIGIERLIQPLPGGRFLLPDGSERYLVDEDQLVRLTVELGGEMLDPLKTTVVQNQRSMTTWVLQKNA